MLEHQTQHEKESNEGKRLGVQQIRENNEGKRLTIQKEKESNSGKRLAIQEEKEKRITLGQQQQHEQKEGEKRRLHEIEVKKYETSMLPKKLKQKRN